MPTRTLFPVILGSGGPSGNYAVNLNMSMDSNYVISAQLVDQNGDALGTEQTIDLPLESVVVGGSYDSTTKSLVLTLDNGQSITIPVGDLVSGLQTTIDSNNPLNVDYTTDGTTNKVYTATEQSKLSGIAAGAEVNVQSDWNQSDNTADDYIKNKPTIPAAQIQSDWNQSDNTQADFIKNKPTLGTMAAESATDYTPTSSLATVATTGSYPDLHNRPTIPTVNDSTITIQKNGTTVDSFTTNASAGKTINITGVQDQITSSNQLSADLVSDGTTNKVFTATEQSKLANIAAGAEVNVQSDWNESDNTADDYIKNKPTIPAAVSGTNDGTNWTALTIGTDTYGIPSGGGVAQVQSDWTQTDNTQVDYIKNKPTIPDAVSGVNDNTYWTSLTIGSTTKSIPAAQVQANWNESDTNSASYIQNKPTIPAAQVNSDWNSSTGVSQILNKPSMTTETLTFIDSNNVSTTVVVYTQPQI